MGKAIASLKAPASSNALGFFKMLSIATLVLVAGCAGSPPKQIKNACAIFDEKNGWYKHANKSSKKWNIPLEVNMAIMHQESRFRSKAKPPRTKILWIFPGPRKSNAYGFAQAKKETWQWYKKSSGHRGADRDDFDDAFDFIAWYNNESVRRLGLSRNDTYSLYLAYHEGHGGFERKTYANKSWLLGVAGKVSQLASSYRAQLEQCEHRLGRSWWPF